MTNRVLYAILDMSDGSTRKLAIQNPGTDVDLSDVQTVANKAKELELFKVNGVDMQGLVRAYVDEHTITDLV